jgi:hypothetical protein
MATTESRCACGETATHVCRYKSDIMFMCGLPLCDDCTHQVHAEEYEGMVNQFAPDDGQNYAVGTAPCANCGEELVRIEARLGQSQTILWWHLAPEDSPDRLLRGDHDFAVPRAVGETYQSIIPPRLYTEYLGEKTATTSS